MCTRVHHTSDSLLYIAHSECMNGIGFINIYGITKMAWMAVSFFSIFKKYTESKLIKTDFFHVIFKFH